MKLHVHGLEGCRPDVLGLYLKALGVLRLVTEQADGGARGFWRDEGFVLVSCLSRNELVQFFSEAYRPTPLVSPWNKGSGFMSEDDAALDPVRKSCAERFMPLRDGVEAATRVGERLVQADALIRAIKNEANTIKDTKKKRVLRADPSYKRRLAAAERAFKSLKEEDLIPICRREWRGPHLRWLEAALVLDDQLKARFPALLGTGGNDGRLDFTNNFYRRLGLLFDLEGDGAPREGTSELVEAALFGTGARGLERGAAGQFLPGGAGGANSTSGPMGEPLLNTWDFVLALEGSVLFAGAATQRLSTTSVRASAPFAVDGRAAGYGSAGATDEGPRGEQWMPLWHEPWTLLAVRAVLAEGRCQVGARRSRDPIDLARSIARLGVARGIHAFQRFGYIERNGQSNLAVPLGRWPVKPRPGRDPIDDLDRTGWLVQVRRAARDERAPRSFSTAVHRLDDAILAAVGGDSTARWQEVLLALVAVEDRMVASPTFTAAKRLRPIPALQCNAWVGLVDDGSAEVRLALALANAGGLPEGRRSVGQRIDSVRRHWLPLDGRDAFATAERGLRRDPAVVCASRDPVNDLVALVERRITEAKQQGVGGLQLRATRRCHAHPADLAAFVAGEVDVRRCVALARAFMAIVGQTPLGGGRDGGVGPGDLWVALRLVHLAEPLESSQRQGRIEVPLDPSIVRALGAGDGARAIRAALRRLRASNFSPAFQGGVLDRDRARLFAASLAFPVSREWLHRRADAFRSSLDKNKEPEHVR